MRLTLELEGAEGQFLHAALQKASAEAEHRRRMMIETGAPIDETAITEMSAEMYDRLETRVRDLIYPDPRTVVLAEQIEFGIV